MGRTAIAALRRNDRAFRVGGDEFAIILPGADIDTGLAVARRMLASGLNGGDPSHPIEPFSLSIGVSAFPAPSTKGSLLYRHADAALTGASATDGRAPWPTTRVGTAWRPTTAPWPTSPR